MLKVCLNGGRRRDAHPAVPVTPAELAADADRCAERGAAAVHAHPRDATGAESLAAEVIAAAVTALRAVRPGLPVGVSTGAWIEPDPAARVAAVRAWSVPPDFASVNAHEEGAEQVAAALHERGVMVEAGLWTVDAVRAWRRWRVPTGRILIECTPDDPAAALADARAMLDALGADGTPDARTASGGVASGGVALGGVASGGGALGGVASGGVASGGVASGGVALGGVASGGVALGGVASGGGASGGVALGGVASGGGASGVDLGGGASGGRAFGGGSPGGGGGGGRGAGDSATRGGAADDGAAGGAGAVVARGSGAPSGPSVLLHGEGAAAWAVLAEAVRRGLDTRIGLEDTLFLPDGRLATGNAALVDAARSLGAR